MIIKWKHSSRFGRKAIGDSSGTVTLYHCTSKYQGMLSLNIMYAYYLISEF